MSPRAREISVDSGMYLKDRGFRKVKVNGLTPEGGPPGALQGKSLKSEIVKLQGFLKEFEITTQLQNAIVK